MGSKTPLCHFSFFLGSSSSNSSLNSVELYHPSKKFDINLPDLPSDLFVQEISGLWIDGKLLFCGMKMVKWYLTCYELMKNQGRNTGHGPLSCTVC